ncbi:hypothetical protein L228DRAFT_236353 [Xylona heveae TC161]|uniref:Biogenesis of lysosome-related organelles complex 1 subunit KXD1 n=1 Tax=Xylona heveae (strain CBS 132557 / TC161) TaxID=1328760 RepID=A0A165IQE1_XYLHT|nr:hypothetical protein L228DRAFT_236353 [Xylona heveae TC161]KZF25232.1 hypothetical protein L228DRAFT_236353 [Xylona heveae TC161]
MSTRTSYATASLPISTGPKGSTVYPHHGPFARGSISPPESVASTSATSSGGPSYSYSNTNSVISGSYANSEHGSTASSSNGLASIDLVELLNDHLSGAFDPLPLDKSLAKQAQTSGELNAKRRELLELQALAQRRLAATKANFADGIKAAKEVRRDLEWTQKKVTTLKAKTERKYPAQYRTASQRIPAPVDY